MGEAGPAAAWPAVPGWSQPHTQKMGRCLVRVMERVYVISMSERKHANPLRGGLLNRALPDPCTVVIFGATGDLTHRKLVPALYNLAVEGALPQSVNVVGFARRDKTDEIFREELGAATRKYSRQSVNEELWASFSDSIFYHRSAFDDAAGYTSLAGRLNALGAGFDSSFFRLKSQNLLGRTLFIEVINVYIQLCFRF